MNNKLNFFSSHNLYLLAVAGFFLCLSCFWPGTLTPDSSGQMAQALSGHYSNHHPPLMAFFWRYLMKIYPGPGLMLVMHLGLLWSSVVIFYEACRKDFPKGSFIFLGLPFWPAILSHVFYIWKDVAFGVSCLFIVSILTYYTIHQKRIGLKASVGLVLFMLYAAAVKYQALYVMIVPLLWCLTLTKYFSLSPFKKILFCLLGVSLFIQGKFSAENLLIDTIQDNHSWQYARLYELATISIQENKELFPEYILKNPYYSMETIKERYKPISVDDIMFPKDSPLISTTDSAELKSLRNVWIKSIKEYPGSYLKCRYNLWIYNLKNAPAWDINWQTDIVRQPLKFYLKKFSRSLSKFIYPFFLAFGYLIFGLYYYKKRRDPYAYALVMISITAITLPGVLFFLSMAGTARYIFMSSCLMTFGHLLAWMTYKCWKTQQLILPDITLVKSH